MKKIALFISLLVAGVLVQGCAVHYECGMAIVTPSKDMTMPIIPGTSIQFDWHAVKVVDKRPRKDVGPLIIYDGHLYQWNGVSKYERVREQHHCRIGRIRLKQKPWISLTGWLPTRK